MRGVLMLQKRLAVFFLHSSIAGSQYGIGASYSFNDYTYKSSSGTILGFNDYGWKSGIQIE